MSRAWWRGNAGLIALVAAAGILLATPREAARAQPSPGLVDTLQAICGKPRLLRYHRFGDDTLGLYRLRGDTMLLDVKLATKQRHAPSAFITLDERATPDYVLAHEFGHRYDARRWNVRANEWMRPTFHIGAGSWYANWNLQERFAEVFANAIDFLRWTSTGVPDRGTLYAAVRQREWFTPGFVFMVGMLLREPIYARHPLNAPAR